MLTIVFISLTAILSIALVIVLLTVHKRIAAANAKVDNRYKTEIKNYEDEVHRLKFLYDDLKNSKEPEETFKGTIALPKSRQMPDNFVIEQKKLEQEKEEMAIRNKKLWDMSIQIQKEKIHIQYLKNDIENRHKSITDSIKYAKRIQDAILPKQNALQDNLSDYFLFWLPKETVSGDFYWMKRIGDLLIFTVADCTGHGVPGAFMSMMGVTFLNEVCSDITEETSSAEILESMRSLVITTLKQENATALEPKDGMDMALCILDLRTKKIKFSGANNPMYLVRNGELQEHKSVKNPVGQYPRMVKFQTEEIQAQEGDWIYMFSDGFADQFNGVTGRKVTYGRFKNLLVDINKTTQKSDEQKQKLLEFITSWRGEFVQMDDILVGGYRI